MSNKGKRIYLIIIWVITLIVILFGIYRFVGSGSWNIFSFGSGKYAEKTEDLSADITELDVDVHSANVIIEEGDAPSKKIVTIIISFFLEMARKRKLR